MQLPLPVACSRAVRYLGRMAHKVDVFWSFRSPYSYLAVHKLQELERDWEVELAIRPVLPIAVRIKDFFDRVNPLWPPYLLRDCFRLGQYYGIGLGWPSPDPIVQAPGPDGRLQTAAEQPYIYRLTRLGVCAVEQGKGLPFLAEVSRIIFGGIVVGWDQGSHLADAAARAGCDLDALDRQAADEAERLDAVIAANQQALEDAGHWGVPTMVYEDEPFFGQDRIELLRWRMEQNGLKRRSS